MGDKNLDTGIAIKVKIPTSTPFCFGKIWGNPDLPKDMPYPMQKLTEDGSEYDYPLTFLCQIDCYELSKYDKEGLVPEDGMIYVFAAMDEYMGYESPVHNGEGDWSKGNVVVKYTKNINLETFESFILLDDDDQPMTLPPFDLLYSDNSEGSQEDQLKLVEELSNDEDGLVLPEEGYVVNGSVLKHVDEEKIALLHLESDRVMGLEFPEGYAFEVVINEKDLKFGNWKRAYGRLLK